MKLFKLIIFFLFLFICINNIVISQPITQYAPVTTINNAIACPNTIITLHVTATNLIFIGSVNFEIDYNGAVLSYIDPNPNHIPGNFHNTNNALFNAGGDFFAVQSDLAFVTGFKKLRCGWVIYSSIIGVVPDTIGGIAQILDLTFKYYGGNTSVIFNNSGGGGGQVCEWADTLSAPCIDLPTEYYYHDGTVTECSIGINNINKSRSDLLITPNPAKETIYIRSREKGYIYIYNVLGEVVLKTSLTTIDVSGLSEGTYILKFVSNSGVVTKKLIIE